jgi:hypothetical protein
MTSLGQLAVIITTRRWDRIKSAGGQGWEECNRALDRVNAAAARQNKVRPRSEQFLQLDQKKEIGPQAENELRQLRALLRKWDPQK